MTWTKKRKVEVIADASRARDLVRIADREGASGYTIVPDVSGKGHRGVRSADDIFDERRNVLFVVVASDDVATRIADAALRELAESARIVLLSDVFVTRDEHFP